MAAARHLETPFERTWPGSRASTRCSTSSTTLYIHERALTGTAAEGGFGLRGRRARPAAAMLSIMVVQPNLWGRSAISPKQSRPGYCWECAIPPARVPMASTSVPGAAAARTLHFALRRLWIRDVADDAVQCRTLRLDRGLHLVTHPAQRPIRRSTRYSISTLSSPPADMPHGRSHQPRSSGCTISSHLPGRARKESGATR
jgi:hypothetical protein